MNLTELPANLPVPIDDGAADHLETKELPTVSLLATNEKTITIRDLSGLIVVYIYPMTGRPGTPLPGARGCTPQSCCFRDHFSELQKLDARVYGVSAQSSEYQREAKKRLHLPFELLSDSSLELKEALRLPTFKAGGMDLYKRITLIARDGIIEKVFYPVFPPSSNAEDVIEWLTTHA